MLSSKSHTGQHYSDSITSNVWYENCAVGKNKLNTMLKAMSLEAGLSQIYTNHCLRKTTIMALKKQGVCKENIRAVTGHKHNASLQPYFEEASYSEMKEMSHILGTYGKHKAPQGDCPSPKRAHIAPVSMSTVPDPDPFDNEQPVTTKTAIGSSSISESHVSDMVNNATKLFGESASLSNCTFNINFNMS